MTLPASVQRDAAELAQLEQALYTPQVDPAPPPAEPEPPAPAPVDAAPPAPAPEPVETLPPPAPAVDYEQKYRSLQGVFNSMVPKLQDQIRQMNDELQELKRAKPDPTPPEPKGDPKDAEVFGADVVDMVVRTAERLIQPRLAPLDARVAKLEQLADSLTQTSTATAEEVFFRALDGEVPDWQAVNQDPRFLAWLEQVDPVYRQPRRAALTLAREQLDARGVVSIFKVFKQTLEPAVQPPAPAPAPKQPSLEQQVVPGSTGAPAPTAPPAKPLISEREVSAFFTEVAQGKWRGREAQAAAREAEYHLAYTEGRVR